MLSLYYTNLKVRYMPRGMGAWLFYLACLLIVLGGAFAIPFVMGNFWTQHGTFVPRATTQFTNQCVLAYTTFLGKEGLWACSAAMNALLQGDDRGVVAFFSLYAEDRDGTGGADQFHFEINIPLDDGDSLRSLAFLPEFIYSFAHSQARLNMTAAPLVIFETQEGGETGAPLTAVIEGDLLFHSTVPLGAAPYVGQSQIHSHSLFTDFQDVSEFANVRRFAAGYARRDQSLVFVPYSVFSGADDVAPAGAISAVPGANLDQRGSFSVFLRMRVPRPAVAYVPPFQESLKWAWVQYSAFGFILQWLLWWVRGAAVTLGLVQSTAYWDPFPRRL